MLLILFFLIATSYLAVVAKPCMVELQLKKIVDTEFSQTLVVFEAQVETQKYKGLKGRCEFEKLIFLLIFLLLILGFLHKHCKCFCKIKVNVLIKDIMMKNTGV